MTSFKRGDRVIYHNNNGYGQPTKVGQYATFLGKTGTLFSRVLFEDHTYRNIFTNDGIDSVYTTNLELAGARIKEPDESIYNDLM